MVTGHYKCLYNLCIGRTFEMFSSVLTHVGKHIMSNIACVHCQPYTNNSVFWLALTMLCIKIKLPAFCQTKLHYKCYNNYVFDRSISHGLLQQSSYPPAALTRCLKMVRMPILIFSSFCSSFCSRMPVNLPENDPAVDKTKWHIQQLLLF